MPKAHELAAVFGADLALEDVVGSATSRRAPQVKRDAAVRPKAARAKPEATGARSKTAPAVSASRAERSVETPASEPRSAREPGEDLQTIRVATAKVDRLMANVEELVQVKAGGPARVQELQHLSQIAEALSSAVGKLAGRVAHGRFNDERGGAASAAELKALQAQADAAVQASGKLLATLRSHTRTLDTLAARLQDDIRSVRMLPLQAAFGSLPRLVRDLGHKCGKRVTLKIEGGSNEMDRDLLQAIKDPLVHLLRNAVAHGVEPAEQRKLVGKPEVSELHIVAQSYAGGLQLTIRDDGAGVDLDKVRARSRERQLGEDVSQLSDGEALNLIFLPGLSTADSVDEVSGRGVGLDAVRAVVERCGGSITVESQRGRGTSFQLRLPVNLATLRMLLLRVGSDQFAVPINSVVRILRVRPEQVRPVDSGYALELDGRAIPVARLDQILGLAGKRRVDCRHAVVVASGAEKVALLVDAILGEQELIMKSLGDHLVSIDKIAGATVLATGRIVPLLNVSDIVRHLSATRAAQLFSDESSVQVKKRRVLIVDDSITTRTLERSILEAVGYLVEVATDGEDALVKLGATSFDLVLSDVQMPRMDGIALVSRIKQSDRFRNLPVVLVSSLDAEEDRRRGLEAGADAYLGKSDFRQELLLETLDRLL
jgi:two-component system chemotaxis sensor kinase CheA